MSWLFAKPPLSVDSIKFNLKTFHQMMNEHIDYYLDDYVVLKMGVMALQNPAYDTLPQHAYIVSFHIDSMKAAYVKNDVIVIDTINPHFYQRAEFDLYHIPDMLSQFVSNASVEKDVKHGVLIKQRQHHKAFTFVNDTPVVKTIILKEPAIIVNNDHGLLTIVGYDQEDSVTTHQVFWY